MFKYLTYKDGYKPSKKKELEYKKILEKAVLEAYAIAHTSDKKEDSDNKKLVATSE